RCSGSRTGTAHRPETALPRLAGRGGRPAGGRSSGGSRAPPERNGKNAGVNRYDFEGRVALVTGGASGIGAATVELLRAGGARVAVFDLQDVDGDVLSLRGDVSRSADVDAAVERVVGELGGLDVLVNSAGIPGRSLRTHEVDDEEWQRVVAINAPRNFWVCRAASPRMGQRGYRRRRHL